MKNVNYDAGWRHLLGLPVIMEHLLRGFAGPVADLLDLSTLRELSAGWTEADPGTAAKARRRYGDGVWRAGYADGSGRSLVSLLEVQSRGDRGMAERIRRYEGVAYNRLRRQGAMDADGELRLVSIVVHTGRYPWAAPGGADRIEVTADGEAALPVWSQYLPLAPQAPSPSGRRSLPQPKPAGGFAGFAACAPNPANSPVYAGWRANNCRRAT